ncbi:MAG: S-methyl-5-thioribose-1-phosphate isomerase [Promethearchaeota archaeon]
MRVKVEGQTLDLHAVQMKDYIVSMIDQRWLPFKLEIKRLTSWQDTVKAIKDLVTRGAGSVGVAGAFAMAQAAHEIQTTLVLEFNHLLQEAAKVIVSARPTAVTLSTTVDACLSAADKGTTLDEKRANIDKVANQVLASDISASQAIGKHGSALLKHQSRVLTHCNTGGLAIQDYGSALSVIKQAFEIGNLAMVYVSETRPWLQGSRLTTWELQQYNIPHQLLVDSACGYLFSKGKVDAVIVGADRIVANGDVANKIGTYEKALLAHIHKVPFYIAAPLSTFDLDISNGNQIVIEERPAKEVRTVIGRLPTGEMGPVQVAPDRTEALNPIFDVTPARYVTGLITEKGVLTKINPKQILKFVGKMGYSSQEKGI